MPRSSLMRLVQRVARNARDARGGVEAVQPCAAVAASRRAFLKRGIALGTAAVLTPQLWPRALAAASATRVVVVGAGLAGLAAAYELQKHGVIANIVDATPRVGGRCWTERSAFDEGQIAERGGELIDSEHREIRALVAELSLELDDLLVDEPADAEPIYIFDDGRYTVADATRDFTALLPALDADAGVLGDDVPTFRKFTPAQRALDRMSALAWIETRVPGGIAARLGQLLGNAYIEELGGDLYDISAVGLVVLLNGSPRDRLSPYAESDQRYHVRGGNDRIARALATALDDRIATSQRLLAIARSADGRYRLTFGRDQALRDEIADRVVLALPYTLLRQVDLDRSAFRPRKLKAIRELGMGRSTKLQLQFRERPWRGQTANGETRLVGSYQTTWEVTRTQAGSAGILNFFSGGTTATRSGEGKVEESARRALADLERALPGVAGLWNGKVIRNAWDRNPWTLGSYSLFKPGQYTTLNGILREPEGAAYFAGEHTSDAWSGYMNGAVESGQRAAAEVLSSLGIRSRGATARRAA
jgi:monoamine oxidase